MKRVTIATAVILALVVGASLLNKPPKVFTVHAQSLPATRTVAWDANAVSEGVVNYVVRLDGVVIASPTGTSAPFTVTTAGAHTLAIRAVGLWAESVDTVVAFNVVVPTKPANVRIQ